MMSRSSGSEDVLSEGKLGLMLKDELCQFWSLTGVRLGVHPWTLRFMGI